MGQPPNKKGKIIGATEQLRETWALSFPEPFQSAQFPTFFGGILLVGQKRKQHRRANHQSWEKERGPEELSSPQNKLSCGFTNKVMKVCMGATATTSSTIGEGWVLGAWQSTSCSGSRVSLAPLKRREKPFPSWFCPTKAPSRPISF